MVAPRPRQRKDGCWLCSLLRVVCVSTSISFLCCPRLSQTPAGCLSANLPPLLFIYFGELIDPAHGRFRDSLGREDKMGFRGLRRIVHTLVAGRLRSDSQLWATYWQRRTLAKSKQHVTRHVSRRPLDYASPQQRSMPACSIYRLGCAKRSFTHTSPCIRLLHREDRYACDLAKNEFFSA